MSVEGKFLSKEINDLFWREGLTLVTAESCTAGSVAAAITAVAGSSQFFKGGIIAYSNEIKESLLGVNHETLETHGAVSEETVIEMVKGAMKSMNSDCAVATSGIAGPTGGTPDKPVGTIWIAAGCKDKVITLKLEGDEGRNKNITGKKAMIGNNVSHSKRRTKRTFDVNLFTKKFYYVEQDCWISLNICANGLRVINKKGLDAALNEAVTKGYCDWKSIKIIG